MSNERTAERYYNLNIKDFKEALKLERPIRMVQHFSKSRRLDKQLIPVDEQDVQIEVDGRLLEMDVGGRKLRIDTTPCNYGAARYWFICPMCGDRCARLFFKNKNWRCRACGDLVYLSQQRTKLDFWTWYFKAADIAQKIDPDYWENGITYMLTAWPFILFPEKPKGMHYETYEKMAQEFVKYVEIGNNLSRQSLIKGHKRLKEM